MNFRLKGLFQRLPRRGLSASAAVCALALNFTFCTDSEPKKTLPRLQPLVDAGTEIFHGNEVCAGQVLVKFTVPHGQLDKEKVVGLVEKLSGERISISEVGGRSTVLIRADNVKVERLMKVLGLLASNPALHQQIGSRIEYIEPNQVLKLDSTPPNDQLFTSQWGLQNDAGAVPGACGSALSGRAATTPVPDADIDAPEAWDMAGTHPIVVAVLDSGVKFDHEDLRDNMWVAPHDFNFKIDGVMVNCKAGSHGFNAVTKKCDDAEIEDKTGHGTHVAGIIGAVAGNKTGIAGVSPAVRIMAIKITDEHQKVCASYVSNAIHFITEVNRELPASDRVRVLNNSYGTTCQPLTLCLSQTEDCQSKTLRDAVQLAADSDLLFVAAAGNDGTNNDCDPHYPAGFKFENVIAVAATTIADTLAFKIPDGLTSNFGPTSVHIGAPGISVCSLGIKKPNLYAYQSGTSMATPFVSGAAALVLSKCDKLDAAALKSRLIDIRNVDPIRSGRNGMIAGGRLNVKMAVRAACPP